MFLAIPIALLYTLFSMIMRAIRNVDPDNKYWPAITIRQPLPGSAFMFCRNRLLIVFEPEPA